MDKVIACLEICSCGTHGRIVFSDGRRGGEFFSKQNAEIVLYYCRFANGFDGIDDPSLREVNNAINKSSLPMYDRQVSDYFKKVVHTWNTAKLHNPNLNPERFHEMEERLWHYRAYDT